MRIGLPQRPALISAVLTVVFVIWSWHSGMLADWRGPWERVHWSTWAWVATGMLASYGLRAWRIRREFADVAGMNWRLSLRIVLAHMALVNVLPMRSGELGFPWLMRRALNVAWLDASASLLWLRLQDACVLATLAAWIWPDLTDTVRIGWTVLLWSGVALAIWVVRHHGLRDHGEQPTRLALLTQALSRRGQRMAQGWLITVMNWTLKLSLQAWLLSQLLDRDWSAGWAGSLGAELSALLPVQGLAGVGSYEAGSAAAMRWHGVPWNDGLQAALNMHLCLLACSVSFGLIAWWLPRPLVTRHNDG